MRCVDCKDTILERTGDKLFWCESCKNFLIEIEGTLEFYIDPPERGRHIELIIHDTRPLAEYIPQEEAA